MGKLQIINNTNNLTEFAFNVMVSLLPLYKHNTGAKKSAYQQSEVSKVLGNVIWNIGINVGFYWDGRISNSVVQYLKAGTIRDTDSCGIAGSGMKNLRQLTREQIGQTVFDLDWQHIAAGDTGDGGERGETSDCYRTFVSAVHQFCKFSLVSVQEYEMEHRARKYTPKKEYRDNLCNIKYYHVPAVGPSSLVRMGCQLMEISKRPPAEQKSLAGDILALVSFAYASSISPVVGRVTL